MRRFLPGIAIGAVLLFAVVSCETVDRMVVVPPDIPGAKFVGSKACAECHEDICRDFATATHANLMAKGTNALNIGCESCHGPGSLHVASGGEKKPASAFSAGRPQVASAAQRQTILNPRRSADTCFDCHLDKRGQFALPHHHPVPEGKLTCNDCHDPHKGPAIKAGGTSLLSENEACLKCHNAQRGPFVFEHEALREGCRTCHEPHGTINAKMLTSRDATLCLKCHFQQVQGGRLRIGGADHTRAVQVGTCWSGGSAGCHEAVHGSQVSPSLSY